MGKAALKNHRSYSYGVYRTWPEEERWELIDGEAWDMSPAPGRLHQQYVMEISRQIANFLEGHSCRVFPAPFDVLLPDSPHQDEDTVATVVQPDISVIRDRTKLTDRGCTGAPDWIIEILSPGTLRKDLSVKFDLYRRHGVKEYWVVDPANRCVLVYVLDEHGRYPEALPICREDAAIPSMVIEGLSVDLGRVFGGENRKP